MRYVRPHAQGEWVPALVGQGLPTLRMRTPGGRVSSLLEHPAVVYFFADNCRFCEPARQRLNWLADNLAAGGVRLYAVTFDSTKLGGTFAPSVRVIPLHGKPLTFAFVTRIPLFVRTDTAGVVRLAYVGIPDERVLVVLLGVGQPGRPADHETPTRGGILQARRL